MIKKVALLLSLPFFLSIQNVIGVELPFLHGLFTDNMILQRDVPCPVWGWTEPGEKVSVILAEQTVSSTAGKDGKWLVEIGPRPAGGSYTITVNGEYDAYF